LFHSSSERPNVLEPFGDDELQRAQPEPIDVLVDVIIGCLEKGTAFMRVVGNRSFSLLSSAVKDTTINLILSVSVSEKEFSSVFNTISATGTSGPLGTSC
jgi:DNA polymerase phi